MKDAHPVPDLIDPPTEAEKMAALFANLVIQQTNMALAFLGKVAHPETGQTMRDLEAAQLMIDQLEMLARKTQGNLDKQEQGLLQESLMHLRLVFVKAVREAETAPSNTPTPSPASPSGSSTPPASGVGRDGGQPAEAEGTHKKFSKKY